MVSELISYPILPTLINEAKERMNKWKKLVFLFYWAAYGGI
jgi:hypothetical protein